MAVRYTEAFAPQLAPASRLKSTARVVNFLQSDSKCQRNVSGLSNFMLRHSDHQPPSGESRKLAHDHASDNEFGVLPGGKRIDCQSQKRKRKKNI